MSRLTRIVLILGLTSLGLFASFAGTQAHEGGSGGESEGEFDRVLGHPGVTMDVRENVIDEINRVGETLVTITIRAGLRETFYTVWLRLVPKPGGANSLTGTNSIALAPFSELVDLFNVTAPGDLALAALELEVGDLPASHCSKDPLLSCEGTTDLVNGFMTDLEGDGSVTIILDYLLLDAVYRLDLFDETLLGIGPLDDPLACADILRANEGAALRLASHPATGTPGDELGHGLRPGPHKKVFDWYLPPPPPDALQCPPAP